MGLSACQRLLASAVQYLIQGGEQEAALLLLFCEVEYVPSNKGTGYTLWLTGPRAAYDALERDGVDRWGNLTEKAEAVNEAFKAVALPGKEYQGFQVRVKWVDIEPGWREELEEIAHGRRVHNQGVDIAGREIIEWGNLRFRSQTEVRIARALDAAGVLFLPNCLARLRKEDGRATKEADFVVCQNGKWGILEVDGPYHPRAATDHERDRLFQQHGIKVTQRFTAEECYSDAPRVVRQFLTLLQRNG